MMVKKKQKSGQKNAIFIFSLFGKVLGFRVLPYQKRRRLSRVFAPCKRCENQQRFERGSSSQTSANFRIASMGQTSSRSWNTLSISLLTSESGHVFTLLLPLPPSLTATINSTGNSTIIPTVQAGSGCGGAGGGGGQATHGAACLPPLSPLLHPHLPFIISSLKSGHTPGSWEEKNPQLQGSPRCFKVYIRRQPSTLLYVCVFQYR
mmetsp:Transcript_28920/g.72356  ORF Transcript_28920/g.72356 Transcript_28920/m.72356 type:complete len:206 (-) Transcript_28920:786-1403(-)